MMSIGSRVHVAVSRSGLECSLYINGQLAGHAASTVSVVYSNAFLVFGVDYRNRSNYIEGTMDHVAIYSQSLSESNIKSLFNAQVGAPTPMPSSAPAVTVLQTGSSGGRSTGCDIFCLIGSIFGTVLGALAIFATYHVYCLNKREKQESRQQVSSNSVVDYNRRYHAV